MSQQALLRRVVFALEEADVPYMPTGYLLSGLQGEPRATHDIDMVVDVWPDGASRLTEALSAPDPYLDGEAAREAVRGRSVFDLIQPTT